jgi:hypothetical protein
MVARADALDRNVIGCKQMVPFWNAESSGGVAANIASAKVVALGHTDRCIPVIVKEEDLKVQTIDRYSTKLLKVLNKATITLEEYRATPGIFVAGISATCREGCADGSRQAVAHRGKSFVADNPLASLLSECLHHDSKGAAT